MKVAASVLSSPEAALGSGTDAIAWAKEGPGHVKSYARYRYPASALKDGVNGIAFPATPGARAAFCEIEAVPKGE